METYQLSTAKEGSIVDPAITAPPLTTPSNTLDASNDAVSAVQPLPMQSYLDVKDNGDNQLQQKPMTNLPDGLPVSTTTATLTAATSDLQQS